MKERGVRDVETFLERMLGEERTEKEQKPNEQELKKDDQVFPEISQLIDFKEEEMCVHGHGNFKFEAFVKSRECILCGSKEDTAYCLDCVELRRGTFVYCKDCRKRNRKNLEFQLKCSKWRSCDH